MSALDQPPSPCPCGHAINFEKSEALWIKKCGHSHFPSDFGRPHLLTSDVFYGQPFSISVTYFLYCQSSCIYAAISVIAYDFLQLTPLTGSVFVRIFIFVARFKQIDYHSVSQHYNQCSENNHNFFVKSEWS